MLSTIHDEVYFLIAGNTLTRTEYISNTQYCQPEFHNPKMSSSLPYSFYFSWWMLWNHDISFHKLRNISRYIRHTNYSFHYTKNNLDLPNSINLHGKFDIGNISFPSIAFCNKAHHTQLMPTTSLPTIPHQHAIAYFFDI